MAWALLVCLFVSRAQKISTVVDSNTACRVKQVSRAQKISTVVDQSQFCMIERFHALKKFLLL